MHAEPGVLVDRPISKSARAALQWLCPAGQCQHVCRSAGGSAGYHTAAIGKSHVQPFSESPPLGKTAEEIAATIEAWRPRDTEYREEEPSRYQSQERFRIKLPYYGYQHVDMVLGHGDRCGGHYGQWFRNTAPDWQELHDRANELPHNYSCPQAFRTPVPEDLYPTAYVRDRAVDYIASRAGEEAPFFAFVSFPDPHHPFNPPGKYWDMYNPDDFDVCSSLRGAQKPDAPDAVVA